MRKDVTSVWVETLAVPVEVPKVARAEVVVVNEPPLTPELGIVPEAPGVDSVDALPLFSVPETVGVLAPLGKLEPDEPLGEAEPEAVTVTVTEGTGPVCPVEADPLDGAGAEVMLDPPGVTAVSDEVGLDEESAELGL